MEEELNKLKENIFYQAEYYISDMGEFAPFASFLENGEIRPVMYDPGEFDTIAGVVFIDELKQCFKERFMQGSAIIGAIAYDVVIRVNDEDGNPARRDALCLIVSIDGENGTEDYYPYMVIDGQCIWK